jgi:ABC-type uncharacterized transport system ATPase subunit
MSIEVRHVTKTFGSYETLRDAKVFVEDYSI